MPRVKTKSAKKPSSIAKKTRSAKPAKAKAATKKMTAKAPVKRKSPVREAKKKAAPIVPAVRRYPFERANEALADVKDARIEGQAVLEVAPGAGEALE